jgi:hypothetical protein
MRKEYPNAYRPWKDSEDAELTELFVKNNNVPITKLTRNWPTSWFYPSSSAEALRRRRRDMMVL